MTGVFESRLWASEMEQAVAAVRGGGLEGGAAENAEGSGYFTEQRFQEML